jgi:hypothetical protein
MAKGKGPSGSASRILRALRPHCAPWAVRSKRYTRVTPMPSSPRRRRKPSRRAGTYGRPVLAAHRPPTAMPRSAATARPAASPARRSAPTISSRRTPLPASRRPAAAPITSSVTASAAADLICSRPASMRTTPWARPISWARWPMAGRDITTNRTVTLAGLVDEAAAPQSSLAFMFWGCGLIVFPLMLIYTIVSYRVFRGKVGGAAGYGHH